MMDNQYTHNVRLAPLKTVDEEIARHIFDVHPAWASGMSLDLQPILLESVVRPDVQRGKTDVLQLR